MHAAAQPVGYANAHAPSGSVKSHGKELTLCYLRTYVAEYEALVDESVCTNEALGITGLMHHSTGTKLSTFQAYPIRGHAGRCQMHSQTSL